MSSMIASPFPAGVVAETAAPLPPGGWLLCFGQAVSRSIYSALFNALCPVIGAFTVSIATPGVVTFAGHGMQAGDRFRLFTSGALPTGLAANTDYYVIAAGFGAGAFQLSATLGGAAINTSGTQSGTHTLQRFPHGAGDGSTTFTLPDGRGRIRAGADAMGGTAAGRLTVAGSGVYSAALGAVGGTESHTLTAAQSGIATHSHGVSSFSTGGSSYNVSAGGLGGTDVSGTGNAGPTSASAAHPNVQPVLTLNTIIKT